MPQDPHKAVNVRQARTGDDTITYDTIKRVKSVTSVNADDELVYNELYDISPAIIGHILKQSRDCSVPSFYSSLNHGLRNVKNDADQLDTNTLAVSVSVTNNESDTVDDYGSEYSFVCNTSVLPIPSLQSLHQEMFPGTTSQSASNDGITTDMADCVGKVTHNIPMTHKSAYDVGSAGDSHEDLRQQLSIDASPMKYMLPLVTASHQNNNDREGENELVSGISHNSTDQLSSNLSVVFID